MLRAQVKNFVNGAAQTFVKDCHKALPGKENALKPRTVGHLLKAVQIPAEKGSLVDVQQAGVVFAILNVHRLHKRIVLLRLQNADNLIPLANQHCVQCPSPFFPYRKPVIPR